MVEGASFLGSVIWRMHRSYKDLTYGKGTAWPRASRTARSRSTTSGRSSVPVIRSPKESAWSGTATARRTTGCPGLNWRSSTCRRFPKELLSLFVLSYVCFSFCPLVLIGDYSVVIAGRRTRVDASHLRFFVGEPSCPSVRKYAASPPRADGARVLAGGARVVKPA